MAIAHLTLENFTAFRLAEFDFVPGVNVLLGGAAVGKTNVLRAVASLRGAIECSPGRRGAADHEHRFDLQHFWSAMLSYGFSTYFDRDQRDRLVRSVPDARHARVRAHWRNGTAVRFELHADRTVRLQALHVTGRRPRRAVFHPAQEVFSARVGVEDSRGSHDLIRRSLTVDLCSATHPVRNLAHRRALREPLRAALGGHVVRRGDRLRVRVRGRDVRAGALGVGARKLAVLARLVALNHLERGGQLLWDAPEHGVDEKYIPVLARACCDLARAGVQVIVATASDVLALEIARGFAPNASRRVRFFTLARDTDADATIVAVASHDGIEAAVTSSTVHSPGERVEAPPAGRGVVGSKRAV